jgi:hypothetical protein
MLIHEVPGLLAKRSKRHRQKLRLQLASGKEGKRGTPARSTVETQLRCDTGVLGHVTSLSIAFLVLPSQQVSARPAAAASSPVRSTQRDPHGQPTLLSGMHALCSGLRSWERLKALLSPCCHAADFMRWAGPSSLCSLGSLTAAADAPPTTHESQFPLFVLLQPSPCNLTWWQPKWMLARGCAPRESTLGLPAIPIFAAQYAPFSMRQQDGSMHQLLHAHLQCKLHDCTACTT